MVRCRIVNTRIMSRMPRIQMPDDYYEQTPDANVHATEAVMNTLRTADLLFDRIASSFDPSASAPQAASCSGCPDNSWADVAIGPERAALARRTVTGLLDSLERRGLVRRTPNAEDRRSLLVESRRAAEVLREPRTLIHRHGASLDEALSDG